MKADEYKIQDVFYSGGSVQYKLPHFQREYAWEKNNWKMFFDDVMSMYDDRSGTTSKHFLGTIVVMTDGTHGISMTVHKIVDGQQRLITASLLLCALRNSISPEQKLSKEINSYLINPREDGEFHFKLVPTTQYGDKQAYFSIILREQFNGNSESKITDAYKYFRKRISDKNQLDLERFVKCIVAGMEVVFVKLAKNEQPYKIFESLNAKGKALTQPDLVRNYVAMRLPISEQEQVFGNYWVDIQRTLQDRRKIVRGMGELTAFLRHYLSYNSGQLPTANRVYETFRNRMETKEFSSVDQFIEEIKVIHRFSRYYNKLLRPQNEPNEEIQDQLIRLNTLAFSSPYPFLMYLYDLYDKNSISSDEFLKTLKTIENHVVRRFLAGESTPYLHNMFPILKRDIDENRISQTTTEALLNKKYPSDHRLHQELISNKFYHKESKRVVVVLKTLNRRLSQKQKTGGYTVLDSEPTIEHIMPQKMSDEWQEHLGDFWEEDHEDYLNTIGNLTIITKEWNSSLSNSEFHEKKSKLAQNALLLNKKYFSQDIAKWNADAIRERTKYLTGLILEVWPALGEQPNSVTGTKPTSLTILGDSFDVKNWREVAIQTAQTILELAGAEEFESLAGKFNKDFKRECLDDKAYKKMPNGWCLRVRRSAEDVVRFCKKLVTSAGLSEKDWDVKYE